jgi:transcriptional regulator with XRE-family HTH domain
MVNNGLEHLRVKRGWSQSDLAAKLRSSRSHVHRIEKGVKQPSLGLFVKIVDALDLTESQTLKLLHELAASGSDAEAAP